MYLIAEPVMQLKIYLYAVSNQNQKTYINQQQHIKNKTINFSCTYLSNYYLTIFKVFTVYE